jgi:hypothetical protein
MGNGQAVAARVTRLALAVATLAAVFFTAGAQVDTSQHIYPLVFPVAGQNTWTDTFGAPRSGGRTHKGTDIFAAKGTPVVAAADGVITRIAVGSLAGRYIKITHDDGWSTYYIHLNNDTPGTDDGALNETLPGIAVGVRVTAGEVIDVVGDSGNAEDTPSHLHFELHTPDGTAIDPAPHLAAAVSGNTVDAVQSNVAMPAAKPLYQANDTTLVGHLDTGAGFNAGLAVADGIVYMGTWGRPDACPNTGVRVIDATDPANPELLAALAGADEFPETSTDSVWVSSIATPTFTGDIAVVSIRLCDTSERNRRGTDFRGLAIYDVTDPSRPELLSTVDSGDLTQGVHDVTGVVRSDGTVLVAATVMQSYLHTDRVLGDWRLLDVTNPAAPVELTDWDFRATLPEGDPGVGDINLHTHSTTFAADGMSAWLAAWDAGPVLLDLSNPAKPAIAAQVPIGDDSDGNTHSIAYDPDTGLLIRGDEDLEWAPEGDRPAAWGAQTFYDASDLSDVSQLATFATERSDLSTGDPVAPGYFSSHEILLSGGLEYVSWYSDGLRVVDVSDPTSPTEVASFVPAPKPDPQQYFKGQGRGSSFAMVWGVELSDGLIYVSDLNSGLWVVRLGSDNTEVPAEAL